MIAAYPGPVAEPKLEILALDADGWCDPETGVCAMPTAAPAREPITEATTPGSAPAPQA